MDKKLGQPIINMILPELIGLDRFDFSLIAKSVFKILMLKGFFGTEVSVLRGKEFEDKVFC